MAKGIKITKIKNNKKPKKSSSKKSKVKTKRYFSYHFIKYKRGTKLKMEKDNFFSNNSGSTKPTLNGLELVNSEDPKSLENTIISDILLANNEEFDIFSYDNIRNVQSNKENKENKYDPGKNSFLIYESKI